MKHTTKGFSLIETIIYIGLSSFIFVSLFLTTYRLLLNQVAIGNKTLTEEEANFILRKIEWALTGSPTITTPTQNSSSTILFIDKYNYASNPIVFDQNGTSIRMQTSSSTPLPLNSSSTIASNLLFQYLLPYTTSTIAIVQTSFTLDGKLFSSELYIQK